MALHKITPHLWFDKEAEEAAEFYCSVFPESRITNKTVLRDTPSGDTAVMSFDLWGCGFMGISAGPLFTFNPSVSFFVNFGPPHQKSDAKAMLDDVWEKLHGDGGKALMPLGEYPFSEHYGWVQDKYGVSWQLILTGEDGDARPPIVPSLLFVGDRCGQAEEAVDFYVSVFADSEKGQAAHYGEGMEPDRPGTLMFGDFKLIGEWFAAMDSAHEHKFSFGEAISFLVQCEDQKEIDYYWEKLSAVPEAEQCGWLKDKYGVSWQISPRGFDEWMGKGTREQIDRVTQAFMPMKKLDIATLERAFAGD
ncbi:VOC family protein [Longispora albida]|uniref:VOC family protein n=1 Tax=Longispora albida TaxID=203523 RepID=UPI000377AF49|nr:VOC family protein [Longispora albida]